MESIINLHKLYFETNPLEDEIVPLSNIINQIVDEIKKLNYINRTTYNYNYDKKIDEKYVPIIINQLYKKYGKFLDVGDYVSLKPNHKLVSSLVVNGKHNVKTDSVLSCILESASTRFFKP